MGNLRSIESFAAGALVRPICSGGIGLVVHSRRGEVVLEPDDTGIITYHNLASGNILVLCRGELCQSSEYDWVPLRGGEL